MRKIFSLLVLLVLFSCQKENQENVDLVAETIEMQDHVFSFFEIAYDVISHIDSPSSNKLFPSGFEIEWIDTFAIDSNRIEAILHFNDKDDFNGKYLSGLDRKLRKGSLLLIANNSLNGRNLEGEIRTIDSIDFFSGYNFKKMNKLQGSLYFRRTASKQYEIQADKFEYISDLKKGNLSMYSVIDIESKTDYGLWGNSIYMSGVAYGKFGADFQLEITKPLLLTYSYPCSAMFHEGEQKVTYADENWHVNYNTYNTDECNRQIKLVKGRKEYFRSMY